MQIIKMMNTKVGMVVAVGAVGLGVAYLAEKKAREAIGTVGEAINPTNNDNIFASGVNAIGAKVSGNENWKLGSWIYDVFHNEPTP